MFIAGQAVILVSLQAMAGKSHCHGRKALCVTQASTEPSETLRVKPVFAARGDRSYLLSGGLGGFGLALAVWLSQRGARHITLTSKRCASAAAGVFQHTIKWRHQQCWCGRCVARCSFTVYRHIALALACSLRIGLHLIAVAFCATSTCRFSADCPACAVCSGLRTGEQAKVVRKLEAAGCVVDVSTLDVADPAQAAQLLADAGRRAPVGGVFHLAMVLEDRLIVKQARPVESAISMLNWLLDCVLPAMVSSFVSTCHAQSNAREAETLPHTLDCCA